MRAGEGIFVVMKIVTDINSCLCNKDIKYRYKIYIKYKSNEDKIQIKYGPITQNKCESYGSQRSQGHTLIKYGLNTDQIRVKYKSIQIRHSSNTEHAQISKTDQIHIKYRYQIQLSDYLIQISVTVFRIRTSNLDVLLLY